MKKILLLLLVCFSIVPLLAQWTPTSKPANAIVTATKLQRDTKFSIDR